MQARKSLAGFLRVSVVRAFLLFSVLAFIFFLPPLISNKIYIAADNLYRYYPWKFYAPEQFLEHNILITDPVNLFYPGIYNRQLKTGEMQQWNPYVLGGVPATGSASMGNPGRFYPTKALLHYFFSPHVAFMLLLFIHLQLMGFLMYLYLTEIGAGHRGALFGGVAYMFNGCTMVWFEFESWAMIGALLPLLMFFMERYSGEKRFFSAFAGGAVLGLILLSGQQQLSVYVVLFMFFYLLFLMVRYYMGAQDFKKIGRIILCFALTSITGLLIGAVEILPYAELIVNSSRISRTFGFHQFFDVTGRVPFRHLITMVFPDFFGSPVFHYSLIPGLSSQTYMNYNELSIYAGIATVFAFTACLIAKKNRFSFFYITATLTIIAMMAGTYVYYPFFKLVPGMDKMNPTRLAFLFVFTFSAASGLGIKMLENISGRRKMIFFGTSFLILAGATFIAFFGNIRGMTAWFNQEHFMPLLPEMINDFNTITHLRRFTSPIIYNPFMLTCIVFCTILLFASFREKAGSFFLLLMMLLSYDLMTFGWRYNTITRPEDVYFKTPAIEFLLGQQGPFRVAQDAGHDLSVNTLVPFGIEEIGGYASLIPLRTNRLFSYIGFGEGARKFGRWVTFNDFSSKLFDLVNVRYVLTAPGNRLPQDKFRLVFQKDMAIYENIKAMPRAYIVHEYTVENDLGKILRQMNSDAFDVTRDVVIEKEPSAEFLKEVRVTSAFEEVRIDKYTSDKTLLTAELSSNGWLILSDTYYPGWKASVDGRDTAIQRANYNFRAIELNAGKHEVVFAYKPASFHIGRFLSLSGVVLACAGIIAVIFSGKITPRSSADP